MRHVWAACRGLWKTEDWSSALWNDERGVVLTAELVLVLSIGVLAAVVGFSELAVAVNTELNDTANAIGGMDQSFYITGFFAADANYKDKSRTEGSKFTDRVDDCDLNLSCEIVCGARDCGIPFAEGDRY